MIASLAGVMRDGATPKIVAQAPQPLSMTEGEYAEISLAVTGEDGAAFDLTGYELWLTVRRGTEYPFVFEIQGAAVSAPAGTAKFVIPSEDSIGTDGDYEYDAWIVETATDKNYPVVPVSAFVVFPAMFNASELP